MGVPLGGKISFLIIFLIPIIFSQMVEPLWSEDNPNYKKCLENPNKEVATICLISTGNTLSEEGKYKEAEQAFKEAIKISSKSGIKANAYLSLGNTLGRQEKYSEAIGFLQKAVKIDPELGSAWHDLGVAYFKIGKFDGAIQAFKRAISVTKIDWIIDNSYLNLTYIYLIKMDASNTKKDYEILHNRNPILATKFLSELEENPKLWKKFQSFTE
jgi:tetratricopeptide (TPR) repeat protein